MEWYEGVANFVCKVLEDMNDEKFISEVLDTMYKVNKDPDDQKYIDYDLELSRLYEKDADIESAGYKVLQIIKKLKEE